MMDWVQPGTRRGMLLQIIGSRNTVPPRMFLIVPFGLSHIFFNLNSTELSITQQIPTSLAQNTVIYKNKCINKRLNILTAQLLSVTVLLLILLLLLLYTACHFFLELVGHQTPTRKSLFRLLVCAGAGVTFVTGQAPFEVTRPAPTSKHWRIICH